MPNKNTDMGITLTGLVDLSQARKDIDAFTKGSKDAGHRKIALQAEVDVDSASKKLENAINNHLVKKVEDGMKRVNTAIKTGLNATIDGRQFENVTKIVEKYQNELGKIQERVSYFTGSDSERLRPLTNSVNTLKEGMKELKTETEITFDTIKDKAGNEVSAKITKISETITDTNNKTREVIKTTTEWVDEQGRLNQQIETTDKKGSKLSATINNINNDTKKATKLANELATAMGNIQQPKTDKTSTVTYVDKDGVKTVVQLNNGIKTLTTTTREYTTAQGALVKETKELNHVTGDTKIHTEVVKNKQEEIQKSKELETQLGQEREARKKLNEITTGTTSIERRGKITDWETGKEYEGIITTIKTVDAEGKKATKTIGEFTNAEGQLVEQTRVLDENNQRLVNDQRNVTSKLNESSEAANKASNANKNLSESSKQAAQSQQTLGASLAKALTTLAQYYVASLPIRAFREAVSGAVTTVKEFDSALIEFRKVSDLAGESLTQYVAKLAEMGEITGSTMQAMVEAAT